MAETSRPWDGTTVGDAVDAPYDAATEWAYYQATLAGGRSFGPVKGGIVLREANQLAPSIVGGISPVNVATGVAVINGTIYVNSAIVPIVIPTPAVSTRYDYIVLSKDWVTQTVRIARIAGVEGGGLPSYVQNEGVLWQIAIAYLSITIGGVITLVDQRVFYLTQKRLPLGEMKRDGGTGQVLAG